MGKHAPGPVLHWWGKGWAPRTDEERPVDEVQIQVVQLARNTWKYVSAALPTHAIHKQLTFNQHVDGKYVKRKRKARETEAYGHFHVANRNAVGRRKERKRSRLTP